MRFAQVNVSARDAATEGPRTRIVAQEMMRLYILFGRCQKAAAMESCSILYRAVGNQVGV